MANRRFIQFFNTLHNKPTLIDFSVIVDRTNGNGLGCRSLKGPGIASIYMNSTAPIAGNNVGQGYMQINLQDNYNRYLGGFTGCVSPVTGSAISISGSSVLTLGTPYVITSLGTTTQAQWVAAGLPIGVTAAVGVSFCAAITGGGGGTGQVKAVANSGVDCVEVVGDPNLSIVSNGAAILGGASGAYIILKFLDFSGAVVQPANESVIGSSLYFNNSASGV